MVKGFKYFRVLFTTEGRMKHDMDRRSGDVLTLMQERDGCEKKLSLKVKPSIYQSIRGQTSDELYFLVVVGRNRLGSQVA